MRVSVGHMVTTQPTEEITLDTFGLRMKALAWGPEDGPRVLALAGWQDNAASFSRAAPLLPGLRIVALDFAGHGRSEHRGQGAHYHLADYVADAWGALKALGWEECHLLGHSMGGVVCLLLAASWPDMVRRMAFVDCIGPFTTEPEGAPEQLRKAISERGVAAGRAYKVYESVQAAAAAKRAANPWLSEAGALALAARGTEPCEGGLRFTRDPRLQEPSLLRLSRAHVLAFHAAVRCPTLAILAEDNPYYPREMAIELLAPIDDCRIEWVTGGHHVHLDRPERVAGMIAGFLR